jgi:hypothetical protein
MKAIFSYDTSELIGWSYPGLVALGREFRLNEESKMLELEGN